MCVRIPRSTAAARSRFLLPALTMLSAAASAQSTAVLSVSTVADRTDSAPLDGATVSGPVHIHWPGSDDDARRVIFYLDAASRPEPFHIERRAPFDLKGTLRGREQFASAFDTLTLADGEHTVHAVAFGERGIRLFTSSFTVANGGSAPAEPVATGPAAVPDDSPTIVVEPVAGAATPANPTDAPDAERPAGKGMSVVVKPLSEPAVVVAEPRIDSDPLPDTDSDPADGPDAPGTIDPVDLAGSADPTPGARFTVTCESLTCTFDASESAGHSAPIDDWAWDFGDGSTGESSPVVTHVYASAGERTAALTAWERNEDCATLETSLEVAVGAGSGETR